MASEKKEESVLTREVFRELGRRRWRGKTKAERSAHGKMMAKRKAKRRSAVADFWDLIEENERFHDRWISLAEWIGKPETEWSPWQRRIAERIAEMNAEEDAKETKR